MPRLRIPCLLYPLFFWGLVIGPMAAPVVSQTAKAKSSRARSSKKGSAAARPVDLKDARWPQFLGPDRNNVSTETGLLRKWPKSGPPLVSAIRGLGVGFANVALADNTVYTMGNVGERETVLAIALDSGKVVWTHDNAPAYHNGYGDGPRGTPTIDGTHVYALGATGQLACLDRDGGGVVWTRNLGEEFGSSVPGWGTCESVLIDGDHVICTPGGRGATMAALDKLSGAVVWKAATPESDRPAYASMIAIDVEGVRQYVNFTATGVIGVRAADGAFLWRDNSSANGTANCCAPVFADGMLLSASGYGKGATMLLLKGTAGDKTRATAKYHTNDLTVQHGGLVLLDGHVYGSSDPGILACVELKSGKVKWQNRAAGKGSLTCADGMLILRSEQGPVALVQASPAAYKELGRFTPPDRSNSPSWTYPVVCGGRLFLRDQDLLQVYAIAPN